MILKNPNASTRKDTKFNKITVYQTDIQKNPPMFCYMCVCIHLTLETPWLENQKNEIK